MKTRIWLALIIVFVMIACDKDTFETVPQLELRSRTPDGVIEVGGDLRLNIEFRDKEGDVSDSLTVVRQRLNVRGPVQLPNPYDVPDFPHTDKGEFEVTLDYQFDLTVGMPPITLPGSIRQIDTLRLKIVARDKAGNKSDTLFVDNVYVKR